MKLLYTRNITFLVIAIAFIHTTRAQQQRDPSLFDLNEANEQDTYNMIEQMQDLSPEDQLRDDEISEIERMDRHILQEQLHIKQEQQLVDDQQQQEEEDHEGDDGDIPLDFKNHDDTEFFDHPPMNNHVNDIQEEEEDDEDTLDEEYEEYDEEIEILGKNTVPIPPESKVEAPIPWHRPGDYGNVDSSSFYQDENATRVIEKSRFKVWHSITFFVVFVLIYRWISKKCNRDKKRDLLPIHLNHPNNHNSSKYYKSEIKNC